MITAMRLTEVRDLEWFRQRFDALGGSSVEMAYLQANMVRGFFTADGELVGGYVYCTSAPFRYVRVVPFTIEELVGVDRADDLCECTCIWMDRALPALSRIRIYVQAYRDLGATGKRWVLGGSFNEKIVRLQRQGLPELVFAGQALVHGERVRAWLYVGSRRTCLRGILLNTPQRLWRSLVRRVQGIRSRGFA